MTRLERDHDDAGLRLERLAAPRAEPARDGSPPDERELARILDTATTVPDHGSLQPWRFAVVTGPGRQRLADALAEGLQMTRGTDLPESAVTKMRNKAFAAPCTVVLIASPRSDSNVPVWEQVSSASCTGYAIVLAATALGFGAVWKSAAVLDTQPVRALFGLSEEERLLGWINIGTPSDRGKRRTGSVDLGALVTVIADDEHPFDPSPAT